ncbi:unnamed protein product [Prorocentrum cordatum]|uniref:Uncharacterized protein n=1 Tax=Prorocentrum cordatum TaxID=2364126 RepID=A0ABN9PGS5_9DINO|nr:unnamed protein product [Polarella glacialis]
MEDIGDTDPQRQTVLDHSDDEHGKFSAMGLHKDKRPDSESDAKRARLEPTPKYRSEMDKNGSILTQCLTKGTIGNMELNVPPLTCRYSVGKVTNALNSFLESEPVGTLGLSKARSDEDFSASLAVTSRGRPAWDPGHEPPVEGQHPAEASTLRPRSGAVGGAVAACGAAPARVQPTPRRGSAAQEADTLPPRSGAVGAALARSTPQNQRRHLARATEGHRVANQGAGAVCCGSGGGASSGSGSQCSSSPAASGTWSPPPTFGARRRGLASTPGEPALWAAAAFGSAEIVEAASAPWYDRLDVDGLPPARARRGSGAAAPRGARTAGGGG